MPSKSRLRHLRLTEDEASLILFQQSGVADLASSVALWRDQRKNFPGSLIVEFCCGRGDFLAAAARIHPLDTFLGVDWSPQVAERAARCLAKNGVANGFILQAEISVAAEHLLEAGSVDVIFLNFPDPWPKNRHAGRRVLQETVARKLLQLLKPGGSLFTATDIAALHREHQKVLDETIGFHRMGWPTDKVPHPFYETPSAYQKKGEALARPVWYTHHQKII